MFRCVQSAEDWFRCAEGLGMGSGARGPGLAPVTNPGLNLWQLGQEVEARSQFAARETDLGCARRCSRLRAAEVVILSEGYRGQWAGGPRPRARPAANSA